MKKLILLLAIISCVVYSQTQIKENQIKDQAITRDKLNQDSTGKAVIKRIFAIEPLTITSTGADTGTGDVTIEFDSSFVLAKEDSIPKDDEGGFLKWVDSDWFWDASTYLKTLDTLSLSNRINTKLTASDTTAFRTFSNNKYLNIDSITAINNYIPKTNTLKKFVNSQIFDNGTNLGIGTINPFGFFQITRDPLNTSQPTGIYNSSGDSHTGFFLSGKGNAINEKYGMQFGNYENYAIGGIFSLMTSSDGTTIGDITIDLRAATGDLLLTERMRIRSTGQIYFGTLSGGSKVNVSGAIQTDSVFMSTIAGTSAPFIVTSNKQIANLNADMLDSLHASDFSSVYHTHSGAYCRWRGVGSTDPSTPIEGDVYYNSVSTTVYIYADSRWINLIP